MPMSLDDDDLVVPQAKAAQDSVASQQGKRRYCPLHVVEVPGDACPVPGCRERLKAVQHPSSIVPKVAQRCPACGSYCQADYRRSMGAMLMLVCPTADCGFKVTVPRIDAAARAKLIRREDLYALDYR